jgi:predicted Zn-dependent protease
MSEKLLGSALIAVSVVTALVGGACITLPEPPDDARPWGAPQPPEAPCADSQFAPCLEPQAQLDSIAHDSCEGTDRRVCLVPLGQVSPSLVEHLIDHYRDQYGLTVAVLTPSAVPEEMANPLREQIDAGTLIDYMGSLFPDAYGDPNAVLVGVTPVDLYDKDIDWRYVFGVRGPPTYPKAVISTFRMNPETYGGPPNDRLLFSRARKLLSKYVGLLFYGLPSSPDPRSPLFDSILGPSDLDNMEEPLPIRP